MAKDIDNLKEENYFSGDSFKEFMKEVKKYPLLSKEETDQLIERYQNGDEKAYEKLVTSNLRLVVKEAYVFSRGLSHMQIMDIIQEGIIGLMYAITIYDKEKGALSTIAVTSIRHRINRAIDNKEEEIRRTVSFNTTKRKYDRLISECLKNNQDIPSDEELCDILDVTTDTLRLLKNDSNLNAVSLNTLISDEGDTELEELLGTSDDSYEEVVEKYDNKRLLIVLKEILRPLEYYIIYYRYFDKRTLEEIAKVFSISKQAVSVFENRALQKIKPYMEEEKNLYAKVFQKLDSRFSIDKYKTNPILPQDIAKFLYLKDTLSIEERRLLYLKVFGKYNYKEKELANEMGCTKEELEEITYSLKQKIKVKFINKQRLRSFISQTLKNNGTRIFSIDLKDNDMDYERVKDLLSKSYEDISSLFTNELNALTPTEINLLERYFKVPSENPERTSFIERDMYLTIFGYKNIKYSVSKEKLYEVFLNRINEFNEQQILYLECFFFNKKRKSEYLKKYPEQISLDHRFNIQMRLLMLYYNVYGLWKNTFTKERYLEVKKKYGNKLTERRIFLLDLFYGVNDKPLRIKEIASKLGEDYLKVHDEIYGAREFAIGLDTEVSTLIDIDIDVYKPYVLDKKYILTDETREILKFYIIDGLTYEEIAEKTGLSKARISNIITDGVRKIDYYRFGLIEVVSLTEDEYKEFINWANLSAIDSKILYEKVVLFSSNEEIIKKYDINLPKINHVMRKFKEQYMKFKTEDCNLTIDEIIEEINNHPSMSVICEEDKYFLTLYYGIKCQSNQDGIKHSAYKISQITGYGYKTIVERIKNAIRNIKAKKVGIIKPEFIYIDRDELEKLLKDPHLPITNDKKEIISYLLGINNYPYKTKEEIAEILGMNKASVVRSYERAIIAIYRYINHEIEGKMDFELDILPNLRYFSKSDELFIRERYEKGMTNLEIAKKHNFSLEYINNTMRRIKVSLFEILNDENVRKFDFVYYREVIDNPDIPFYGDKKLAKTIFNLFFGETVLGGMSIPKIRDHLNISYGESSLHRFMFSLIISIYNFKEGIKKDELLTYENILAYYEKHKNEMQTRKRINYENYLSNNLDRLVCFIPISQKSIIFDILKERYPNYFNLSIITREEVVKILRRYHYDLDTKTTKSLMTIFGISEKDFMRGKDINHIIKILNRLDELKNKRNNGPTLRRISENS